MDEFELKRILYNHMKEICHFSQMQVFATSSYQKNYFQLQIDEAINDLINFIQSYHNEAMNEKMNEKMNKIIWQSETGQQIPESIEKEIPSEEQPITSEEPIPSEEQPITSEEPILLREVTLEELLESDGTDGKPAYVAVNSIVYDVTNAIRWAGGRHFGMFAGRDLTENFMNCHNGVYDMLKILPIIGTLVR